MLGTGEESFAELREELFVETFGEEREREGMELAGFDSAMTGLVLGKKGMSGKASKACASWSKRGWFPLIPYK